MDSPALPSPQTFELTAHFLECMLPLGGSRQGGSALRDAVVLTALGYDPGTGLKDTSRLRKDRDEKTKLSLKTGVELADLLGLACDDWLAVVFDYVDTERHSSQSARVAESVC